MIVPMGYSTSLVTKMKNRVLYLEAFLRLIHFYKQTVFYNSPTIDEFCYSIYKSGEFSDLGFDKWVKTSSPLENLKATIGSGKLSIPEADKLVIYEFISGIGTTDIKGQVSLCEMYIAIISERLSLAKEALRDKEKLYNSLGAFGSIFVLIIMW